MIDLSSEAAALFISNGGTVNLDGCTISRNTIYGAQLNSAVISVNAVSPDSDEAQQQSTILRLQQCTLSGNTAPSLLTATSADVSPWPLFEAEIYSDVEREMQLNIDSGIWEGPTPPLIQAPASRPGIDGTSAWFVALQQV